MKKLNVILVFSENKDKILMCKRAKNPYKGKLNLVGGKVEENENELKSAYRELKEETGITENDITLSYLMNFQYMLQDMELEVFMGILKNEVKLIKEVNELLWVDISENFYDIEKFAGEGNIWHMVKQAENYFKELGEN